MLVGPLEILLFVVVFVVALVAAKRSGRGWPWIARIVGCFGIAAVVTPPDPASMVLVAILYLTLYKICTKKELGAASHAS